MSEDSIIRLRDVKPRLLVAIMGRFELGPHTDHGPAHWGRVAFHARAIAQAERVDPLIPILFAWIHDSCRKDEGRDALHGDRASDFASRLRLRGLLPLDPTELLLLQQALALHSDGHTDAPDVVKVCWDADRLDLGRVGIRPSPTLLCTESARDERRIAQAFAWSQGGSRPAAYSSGMRSRPQWR